MPLRSLLCPGGDKRHAVNNVTPSSWAVMGALAQGCGSQRRLLLTLLVNGVWEKKQRQLVNIDSNPKEWSRDFSGGSVVETLPFNAVG